MTDPNDTRPSYFYQLPEAQKKAVCAHERALVEQTKAEAALERLDKEVSRTRHAMLLALGLVRGESQ
jgi:hypothetical protein